MFSYSARLLKFLKIPRDKDSQIFQEVQGFPRSPCGFISFSKQFENIPITLLKHPEFLDQQIRFGMCANGSHHQHCWFNRTGISGTSDSRGTITFRAGSGNTPFTWIIGAIEFLSEFAFAAALVFVKLFTEQSVDSTVLRKAILDQWEPSSFGPIRTQEQCRRLHVDGLATNTDTNTLWLSVNQRAGRWMAKRRSWSRRRW